MFGNELSPTLPLQLLKRATERARETGGRPTRAVRKLWRLVRDDPRVGAALGGIGTSAEALAEWLALVGRDEGLEQLLGDAPGFGKGGNEIAALDEGGPLRKRKGGKMKDPAKQAADKARKRDKKSAVKAAAKAAGISVAEFKLQRTVTKMQAARAAGDVGRAAKLQEKAAGQLAKLEKKFGITSETATNTGATDEGPLGLAAADPSDPLRQAAARGELEKRAAATLKAALATPASSGTVAELLGTPGVRRSR